MSTENIKVAGEGSAKLKPRWIGPFVIIEKKSSTVCKLQLPPTLQIHNTFHISLLKPFIEPTKDNATYERPPAIGGENYSEEYEVEKILAVRPRGRSKEYLIKWKGYPSEDNCWVKTKDLSCPQKLKEFLEEQANHDSG